MSTWCKLRSVLRSFARAREGNVALTFALAAIPVTTFVGAAIDYSHANAVKASLQAALDSTALMLSRDAADLNKTNLNEKASAYFNAMFNKPEATNVKVTATYQSSTGASVEIDGQADVPTTFMGIVGYNAITVTGASTAKWGSSRLRVALVLDTTGSMAEAGKMTALKSATKNLLSQLKSAATHDGDVYVSIIPFAKDVNVGSENINADWINWSYWDAKHDGSSGTCTSNASPLAKFFASLIKNQSDCQRFGYTWTSGTVTATDHSSWQGCITDRGQPTPIPDGSTDYDQSATEPDPSIADSKFPADDSTCTTEMMGLNYDWSSMNNLVDDLSPNGNTNQPIGLVWGWQSLVGGGPLTAPPLESGYDYQQVIILLSDGLNTEDRWSSSQSSIDARMYDPSNTKGTCANIKATGITIYTIQVDTGGDPTSTLLQNCASSTNKFYLLTSANQIVSAFNDIGTNLTKLRVAK